MITSTYSRVIKAVREYIGTDTSGVPKISVTKVMVLADTKARGGTHQVIKGMVERGIILEEESESGTVWRPGPTFSEDHSKPVRKPRTIATPQNVMTLLDEVRKDTATLRVQLGELHEKLLRS